MFNASLILFGLIVGKSLGRASLANVNDVSLPADLQIALDALEIVGRDTRIGRRCSKFLKKLIGVSSLLGKLPLSKSLYRCAKGRRAYLTNTLPNSPHQQL